MRVETGFRWNLSNLTHYLFTQTYYGVTIVNKSHIKTTAVVNTAVDHILQGSHLILCGLFEKSHPKRSKHTWPGGECSLERDISSLSLQSLGRNSWYPSWYGGQLSSIYSGLESPLGGFGSGRSHPWCDSRYGNRGRMGCRQLGELHRTKTRFVVKNVTVTEHTLLREIEGEQVLFSESL